jgi:hypothetical protein
MALLQPDAQIPLHAPGQSFDCEQGDSARAIQQPKRKNLALSVAIRVSVAFGIIAAMALFTKPDLQMIDVNSKFMVNAPMSRTQLPATRPHNGKLGFARLAHPVAPSADDHPRAGKPQAAAHFPDFDAPGGVPDGLPGGVPGGQQLEQLPLRTGTGATLVGGATAASVAPRAPPTTMLSSSAEQVLTLMSIAGVGKLLQGRFPGKDSAVVQKLLLQFLVPATLFKGFCAQTVSLSLVGYLGAGIGMVLARCVFGWLATKVMLGTSSLPDKDELSRTAAFQISTMASALSVLPYASEFLGASFVGLGGLVDLPMKLYMLVVMPILLKMFGEKGEETSSSGGGAGAVVKKLLSDPISLALILGLAVGGMTGGAGLAPLGFVGKAINSLAGAQTAILFLLIGLKLNFNSATPLYSLVCLLATQGSLLMFASLLCAVFPLSAAMQQFVLLFAQGAPSVVGLGVITATANSGVKGYNLDFAFDLVGLAFPISALLQCFAGLMGASYAPISGFMGAGLLGVAGLLRVVFKKKFQGNGQDKPAVAPA